MTAERREEIYPACCGRRRGSASSIRCAARDRPPRPARDQPRSALERARAAAARARRRPASSTASRLPRCAVPHRRGGRGRRDQRRDRRRLGDRQGHPRPLHARRRRASTRAGASRSTSATRPPSTARRSSGSASRRCTAARSSRVAYTPARAGRLSARTRSRMCSTSTTSAGAVEGDADGVEADLGVAAGASRRSAIQAVARRRTRRCLRGPTARTGRSGPKPAPARPALTSTKTRVPPSRATMSSSPKRVRALRSTISQPAAARRAATRSSARAADSSGGRRSSRRR